MFLVKILVSKFPGSWIMAEAFICQILKQIQMKLILRNGGIFLGIWIAVMIVYMLSFTIKNEFPGVDYLWKFSLLPGLVLAFIAMSGTVMQQYISVKKGINWLVLLLLVAMDQGIKIYLFSLEWQSLSIPLIEPVFYLEP